MARTMSRSVRHIWLSTLVCLTLLVQLAAPGVLAAATGRAGALLCAPLGAVSSEAQAAVAVLLALPGGAETPPSSAAAADHCPSCLLAHGAVPPALHLHPRPALPPASVGPAPCRHMVRPPIAGPRVGRRGPPARL